MSKYTTQIRYICESLAGYTHSEGFDNVNTIIDRAAPIFFNFSFPLYQEAHRHELECKILLHYYFREIGFETVGQFKLRLCSTLRDIMPYYNQLYESAALEYNPLNDISITKQVYNTSTDGLQHGHTASRTTSESTTNNTDTEQKTNATHTRAYSNTPQGTISGVENNTYLTDYAKDIDNAGKINVHGTVSNSGTDTTINSGTDTRTINGNSTETTTGKTASKTYQELIKQYRENIINVDKMIIDELSDLFIKLW